jgi:outer membrane lipoprotein SlyB
MNMIRHAMKFRVLVGGLLISLILASSLITAADARRVRNAVRGAAIGAGVGAIVDGGRGAQEGAAVGAVVGALR